MTEEKKDPRRAFLALNVGDQGAVMRTYDEVLRERDAALKSVDAAVASRPIPDSVRRSILIGRDAEWMRAMRGGNAVDWEAKMERDGLLHQKDMQHIVDAFRDDAPPPVPVATSRERLVNFLYLLLRDELAAGVVEVLAHRTEGIPAEVAVTYSNPHVEGYARELATRLVP